MYGSLLLMALLAQAPQAQDDSPAVADEAVVATEIKPAASAGAKAKRVVRKAGRKPLMNRQQYFQAQQRQAERQAELSAANAARSAQFQMQTSQAAALQGIAQAEMLRAQVAERQYILNSQVAGAPQVFEPGVGLVPYRYGVAPSYPGPFFGR